MSYNIDIKSDIERELERIEEELDTQNRIIEDLIWQRSELLTKKQDLEMCALVDCIIENGLSANEALETIIFALRKKQTRQ